MTFVTDANEVFGGATVNLGMNKEVANGATTAIVNEAFMNPLGTLGFSLTYDQRACPQ